MNLIVFDKPLTREISFASDLAAFKSLSNDVFLEARCLGSLCKRVQHVPTLTIPAYIQWSARNG
jgi:hypothetical protein